MKILKFLGLYLGNIKNVISTALLCACGIYGVNTLSASSDDVDWKKSALIMFGFGMLLSAASGVKDSTTDKSKVVVSFQKPNVTLITLSALGGAGIIFIIASFIINKETFSQIAFYILFGIIIVKTIIVESLRIKKNVF